jgi:hypothetical protein
MTYSRFFNLLAIFTLVAAAGCTAAHFLLPITYSIPLTVFTNIMLALLCVGMFILGKRTAGARNKFLFGNVFMGVTILKLFLCGGLIAAYIVLAKPDNKFFVIPFFFAYMVYTALEMVFLVKLAGEGKQPVS